MSWIPALVLASLPWMLLAQTHGPAPAEEVVAKLDAWNQFRLADLELTKPKRMQVRDGAGKLVWVERGRFGPSRLTPFVPAHPTAYSEDRRLLRLAEQSLVGWRDWLYLVGHKTKRVTADALAVDNVRMWGAIIAGVKKYPTDQEAVALAKSALSSGKTSWRSNGKWRWAATLVRFKDERCLSCHSQSKVGDVAGVLVYALHPDPTRTVGSFSDPVSRRKG